MENNENLNMVELNEEELELASGGKNTGKFVKATGNVHVRKKPNLKGDDMGSLPAGTNLSYLGDKKTDERGVVWYKVNYNGKVGWVSSRYSKIVK